MINNDRRNFIFKSTMVAASGVLTACGGGAATALGGDAAPSGSPAAPPDTLTAATVVTGPPGTPLPNAIIRLSGSSVLRAAPYCMGYAFRLGDVPAGKALSVDKGTVQVIPKNVWPDGSLKFAVISGQADVTAAGTDVNLMLIPAPTAVPFQLSTAKLRATEIVAEIGCGTYGTVNWTGADWDTPFQSWVQGPVMSSWIYRKPVGSDKHLVGWLEVRLWASGAVEVLPWIENGYVRVAAPTNKSATFTFTLGKTQRMSAAIDLKHHQRTPLISGTALSYWLAADPGVTARPDTAYLQATELVPSYFAKVDADAFAVQNLVTSYQPLQAGNFKYDQDAMPSSGYQDPIGLLPQHDVLYLTSDAKATYGAVVRNGFSAGRYGLHYRDENTNRPLRFSSFPTLNIGEGQGFKDNGGSTNSQYTPIPTGGNPPQWDVAHSPSVGYMAYLLTGRWYFMEEVQFAAVTNYLGNGDNMYLRVGSKGLVRPCIGAWQTRSCAWAWRALAQALCVTPDTDTALRSEFITSVEHNIADLHATYVAQPNNPFGLITPGEAYDFVFRLQSIWQQDFVTAAFGWSLCMGLPVSSINRNKLSEFFQWKAKSAVFRLGDSKGFWYANAAAYVVAISPGGSPDYAGGTGPWYTTSDEVYQATYFTSNAVYKSPPSFLSSTEGLLGGEYTPDTWPTGMWANLMPAIAYAVRHGVPGAVAARARMTGATNWPTLRDGFNTRPVWAVKPASFVPDPTLIVPPGGSPAWMAAAGVALNKLVAIPNSQMSGTPAENSGIFAYSGLTVKRDTCELFSVACGGHGDSSDNGVYAFGPKGQGLLADNPVWIQRCAPTPVGSRVPNVFYQLDNKPTSRHSYDRQHYAKGKIHIIGGTGLTGSAYDDYSFRYEYDVASDTWGKPIPFDFSTGGYGCGVDHANGLIWRGVTPGLLLRTWEPTTSTFGTPVTENGVQVRFPLIVANNLNIAFCLQFGNGFTFSTSLQASKITLDTKIQSTITFSPSAAYNQFLSDATSASVVPGMDYDEANGVFYWYQGQSGQENRLYVIKPNSGNVWDITLFPFAAGSATMNTVAASGMCGRLKYLPALKGIVLFPTGGALAFASQPMYFLKTST